MAKQSVGAFLAALRKAHGYTQQEVADRLSVSNRTVSSWECDSALPDILLLPALAELYGVTADEILAGERRPGGEAKERELSPKAEEKLLRSKFSLFSARSCMAFCVFAAGLLLLFLCWYLFSDRFSSEESGGGWLLALLILGAVTALLAGGYLIALWRGMASSLEGEQADAFRLRLRRRMALYAFLSAGVCLLFAVVAAVPVLRALISFAAEENGAAGTLSMWLRNLTIERFLPILCVFFALALALFACGMTLFFFRPPRHSASPLPTP